MKTALSDGVILLRPYSEDDVDALYEAVRESFDSLSYWFPWCHAKYSREDSAAWIRLCQNNWASNSEYTFGIFNATSGSFLGAVGINLINRTYRFANLGYWVREGLRGRGIARRAATLAAGFGFEEQGLTRLEIHALEENMASQRLAAALGAKREGILRNRLVFQGEPADSVCFGLLPAELRR